MRGRQHSFEANPDMHCVGFVSGRGLLRPPRALRLGSPPQHVRPQSCRCMCSREWCKTIGRPQQQAVSPFALQSTSYSTILVLVMSGISLLCSVLGRGSHFSSCPKVTACIRRYIGRKLDSTEVSLRLLLVFWHFLRQHNREVSRLRCFVHVLGRATLDLHRHTHSAKRPRRQ